MMKYLRRYLSKLRILRNIGKNMLVSAKMYRIWWKTRKNMQIGELKRVVKSIFRGGKEAF